MILIFGSHGYMGSAIARECERRDLPWQAGGRTYPIRTIEKMEDLELVINASAFIPNPTVDACKINPDETIKGNVIFPYLLSRACHIEDIPFMHLSTGCLFDEQREYSEEDKPTRGWDGYCGFYVGTKLLAEKQVRECAEHYILRLRLPFDEFDHPRNYLTKLTKFDKVFEHVNSLTHRGDFAKWALDLWEKKAAFGTYHCVNREQISATAVTMNMGMQGLIPKLPQFVHSPDTTGARLSCAKLEAAIGSVRSVHWAVAEAIQNWRPANV
jgi:UDP-glucose 4,6-dehydratase